MKSSKDVRLLYFLARHLIVGVLAGWTVLAGLLVLDVARLRTLIFSSEHGAVALVLLAVFMAITFGSLAMGSGVMGLGRDGADGER